MTVRVESGTVEQPVPDARRRTPVLDEWGFFDQPEPRLDAYRWMAPLFRLFKPIEIFHFQLGQAAG